MPPTRRGSRSPRCCAGHCAKTSHALNILKDADAPIAADVLVGIERTDTRERALISQAGGQGLQVMVSLQDLAQARARWGDAQADALLSLFQTKLILSGIADARTLESISLSLGEYDREIVGQSIGKSAPLGKPKPGKARG